MFDLMFPYFSYDENAPIGNNNPGGGMATKFLSLNKVLRERYFFNLIFNFDEVRSPIVVIDPLIIRLNQNRPSGFSDAEWCDQWVSDLKACTAKKILYCSEMEIARWAPRTFSTILEHVDIVTANTDYQKQLIWTLSNKTCYARQLCDPIDTELFFPSDPPKKCRVFSAGRIANFKNTQFLLALFKEVKEWFGDRIETAYFGNAAAWGASELSDMDLELCMKDTVDLFYGGIPRSKLARLFSESLIYVSKTTHDVYSSTHAEILASGCISLGGGHPVFKERPGISGLTDIYSFIDAIETCLEMSESEQQELQTVGRNYIEAHCGFEAFHTQFKAILEFVR